MTNKALIANFRAIVGPRYVSTDAGATEPFRQGFTTVEG